MLVSIVQKQAASGASVDISNLFRRLTLDFTTRFTYGGSLNALESPELNDPLLDAFDQFATGNFLVSTRAVPSMHPVCDQKLTCSCAN